MNIITITLSYKIYFLFIQKSQYIFVSLTNHISALTEENKNQILELLVYLHDAGVGGLGRRGYSTNIY